MANRHPGLVCSNGSIKVGSTGTISSLMCREMESVKHENQACDPPSFKYQSAPVSVPCGATSKRLQPRKNPSSDAGSSSSGSSSLVADESERSNIYKVVEPQKSRQMSRKNNIGGHTPMLSPDRALVDGAHKKDKPEKKGRTFFVEVVDLKCNNPMSGRLKKLGFSKLSESIA